MANRYNFGIKEWSQIRCRVSISHNQLVMVTGVNIDQSQASKWETSGHSPDKGHWQSVLSVMMREIHYCNIFTIFLFGKELSFMGAGIQVLWNKM